MPPSDAGHAVGNTTSASEIQGGYVAGFLDLDVFIRAFGDVDGHLASYHTIADILKDTFHIKVTYIIPALWTDDQGSTTLPCIQIGTKKAINDPC